MKVYELYQGLVLYSLMRLIFLGGEILLVLRYLFNRNARIMMLRSYRFRFYTTLVNSELKRRQKR